MNKKSGPVIAVHAGETLAAIYKLSADTSVDACELRVQPFMDFRIDDGPVGIVRINETHGSEYFYDLVRKKYRETPRLQQKYRTEDDYCMIVNVWLGVFDYYGPDAAYQQNFINHVYDVITPIHAFAYTEDENDLRNALRKFGGRSYTPAEFSNVFLEFHCKFNTELLFKEYDAWKGVAQS